MPANARNATFAFGAGPMNAMDARVRRPSIPAMTDVTWIERPEQLAAWATHLATAPWIALDTESNSMFAYRERVCLVQINAGGALALIDPLALAPAAPTPASLAPLRAALEDTRRPKYLHGAEYDVGALRRDFAINLKRVRDTQQAASLLGWEKSGYGAVVERVTGTVLAKEYTHYDWGTRPLDPGARQYALDDVVHLPAVHDHLAAAVVAAEIEEEWAIANAAVEESNWNGGFDPAGFWKIKEAHRQQPQVLGVLAALWGWRDAAARSENLPPGRLVNGELLLALARQTPTNFQLLKKLGVRGSVLTRHGESLIEAIRTGRSAPSPLPPRPRAREVPPEEEEREDRLKRWRREEADRRKLPLQTVLPARALEHLKRYGARDLTAVPQLGGKRAQRYGDVLRKLCG
jgi:ribonuclease D